MTGMFPLHQFHALPMYVVRSLLEAVEDALQLHVQSSAVGLWEQSVSITIAHHTLIRF
jgi:hypothetical protein